MTRSRGLPASGSMFDPARTMMADPGIGADRLPMLGVYLPMMQASALVGAGQIGLFEAIGHDTIAVSEIARRTAADPAAICRLTTYLARIGALVKVDGRYANSPHVRRWFTRDAAVDYTPGLRWTGHAWSLMATLGETVTRGTPDRTLWDRMADDPRLGPAFSSYMHAFAQDLTPDLMRHVIPPPGARRLLDLGGSHGLHAISYCARHAELEAVIVDFPSALADTAALIAREAMTDRIQLRSGNLRDEDWGAGYDMILLLSVAHNQSLEENRALFARVADALNPGGMFVVHEYLVDDTPTEFQAAFDLTLLVETGTRLLKRTTIGQMIRDAGLLIGAQVDLEPLDKGTLVTAFKPGPAGA